MKTTCAFSTILILSIYSTTILAQNIGIGVTNPLQKLHVGGNVRIDGMASAGTGIITTNASGDLLRTNFSGNANDVLKGNGTFGTVPGGLPTGAIVGSLNPNDANLKATGFSFYGELATPTVKYKSYPGGTSTLFGQAPSYENGDVSKAPAPAGRVGSVGLWSGSEALIWGGFYIIDNRYSFLNDGSKYNPVTDTWTTMSTINAPSSRGLPAAVWTGTEMIIWGGLDSVYGDYSGNVNYIEYSNTGARYNPTTNAWTTISTIGAPSVRYGSSAVWTGTYMVVWGGQDSLTLMDGARYNPATNTWSAIATSINAPGFDGKSKMFWTGTYVLILGNSDSVGRYNPITNTWVASANFPGVGYFDKSTAIWTGSEVWTYDFFAKKIYKYNPATNTWAVPTIIGGTYFPDPNFIIEAALWSDTEFILYGSISSNGNVIQNLYYRYNPGSNSFVNTSNGAIQYNYIVNFGTLFFKAGNVILKWGGGMNLSDPIFVEFDRYSSQGSRIFLTSGISIPTVYTSYININKLFLYRRN